MLEAVVNLASTDTLASAVLSLSETFHCTPLEVFRTMTDIACVIAAVFAIFLSFWVDYLFYKVPRLFRKLRPHFYRIIHRILKV